MLAFLLVFTLLSNQFAPLPPQIAINPETRECGNYWGGDEYVDYRLSPPWKIINYGTPVQIGIGIYKWEGGISGAGVEKFCNQISYTYVSGNLGQLRGERRLTSYAYLFYTLKFAPWCIGLIILLIALFLFVRWLRKRRDNATGS